MELSDKEIIRKDRGFKAKEFLQSEFFTKYLLPFWDAERMKGYPEPHKVGWEEEYRTAFAKDQVYADMVKTMQSWVNEYVSLVNKEKEEPKSINEA